MEELRIEVDRKGSGVVTLSPVGTINTDTCRILDREVSRVLEESVKTLIIDMEGVNAITSAGVGAIVKTRLSLKQKGGDLVLVNLQPQVERVFEIIRMLPPLLNVLKSRQELDDYLMRLQRRITGHDDES